MITSVRFENFKSLRDVSIDLAPFTVLVGANGSGKSSVLQGAHLLLSFFEEHQWSGHMMGRPKQVFGMPSALEHMASLGAPHTTLGVGVDHRGGFSCRWLRHKDPFQGQPDFPDIYTLIQDGPGAVRAIAYPSMYSQEAEFFGALPPLRPAALLQLDSALLAYPEYSDDPDPHVDYDGSGLAPTLQKLQVLRDGRFERIEEGVTKIVPAIRRLRAVPSAVKRRERQRVSVDGQDFTNTVQRERTGAKIQADVRGVGWIDADLLSEGTLLVLALLTALHDEAPSLLLLDDIDRALHPLAQAKLITELRAIQAGLPTLQIVATTHSPFVVDCCAIEEVRVMRLRESGASECRPLGSHPRWEKRQGYLSPGEFWSGVGEDWVGGTP